MVRISNLELVKLLKKNSRASFVDIARHFGVSETAVRKKMKRLEEDGVIRKYTIDADPKKIGFEIDVLIGIDTRPEKYIQIMEKMKNSEEVMSMCASSGDHMMLIECWFENSAALAKFVKALEKIDGITKICPAIITDKMKC
jgi:Lrp/AsnC family transcriptional regulator for asnA, asnC and gidA